METPALAIIITVISFPPNCRFCNQNSNQGSPENLNRLYDPSSRVDIGFVRGGMAAGKHIDTCSSAQMTTEQNCSADSHYYEILDSAGMEMLEAHVRVHS